jgi:hypothetical protein
METAAGSSSREANWPGQMSKGAVPWDIAAFTRGDWEGADAVAHRVGVGAQLRRSAAQWPAMSDVALADVTLASYTSASNANPRLFACPWATGLRCGGGEPWAGGRRRFRSRLPLLELAAR